MKAIAALAIQTSVMKNMDRVVLSVLLSFLFSLVIGKILIPVLQKFKFGQYVRQDGPESHLKKEGTPTMGGIIFLFSILLTTLIFHRRMPLHGVVPILIGIYGFGLIGFLDDFLKIHKKQSEGLTPGQKMMGQILITILLLVELSLGTDVGTGIRIPFLKGTYQIGFLYYILAAVMILGTVNGANFTDGLDGLGSKVTMCIAAFFMAAFQIYRTGTTILAAAVFGALLGFLVYNTFPARVFMGDTGSLALGGFVAASALVIQNPLMVILVAFTYLAEVLSVIIQVAYYKKTKKRFFRMAPIHHHFEKGGWPETEVTSKFTIFTAVLCLIGLLAL